MAGSLVGEHPTGQGRGRGRGRGIGRGHGQNVARHGGAGPSPRHLVLGPHGPRPGHHGSRAVRQGSSSSSAASLSRTSPTTVAWAALLSTARRWAATEAHESAAERAHNQCDPGPRSTRCTAMMAQRPREWSGRVLRSTSRRLFLTRSTESWSRVPSASGFLPDQGGGRACAQDVNGPVKVSQLAAGSP